jgi:hypothetical protein
MTQLWFTLSEDDRLTTTSQNYNASTMPIWGRSPRDQRKSLFKFQGVISFLISKPYIAAHRASACRIPFSRIFPRTESIKIYTVTCISADYLGENIFRRIMCIQQFRPKAPE